VKFTGLVLSVEYLYIIQEMWDRDLHPGLCYSGAGAVGSPNML